MNCSHIIFVAGHAVYESILKISLIFSFFHINVVVEHPASTRSVLHGLNVYELQKCIKWSQCPHSLLFDVHEIHNCTMPPQREATYCPQASCVALFAFSTL